MKTSCACIAAVYCATIVGSAQIIDWATAVDGEWHDSSNWNPQNVPDTPAESARIAVSGTYSIELGGLTPTRLGSLSLHNSGTTLSISEGAHLDYFGTALTNNGVIFINPYVGEYPTGITLNSAA